MSTYAYMRTSTETQARKNGSQAQRYAISEYCEKNSITIDDWFDDEGITGTTIERPELIKMIDKLEKNDTVIVSGISRLWRDNVSALAIKKILCDKKVMVVDIDHPWYSIYDDPDDELSNFLNIYVEFQNVLGRKKLIRKFAEARQNRAKSGNKPCGKLPCGYKWDKNNVVIDPERKEIVKEIFDKYIELKSLYKVKKYCDKHGYKSTTGNNFSPSTLKGILTNDFYIGMITYGGNKTAGQQEIFIDEATFRQANEILKR